MQCGAFHTVLLSEEGDVYSMGAGKLNTLPNNPYYLHKESNIPPVIKPLEKVLSGKKIKRVSCGNNTCLALSEEGKVYGWEFSKTD